MVHSAYKIICIDAMFIGNGDVEGNGSRCLYIARQNANHFVPLLMSSTENHDDSDINVHHERVQYSDSSDEEENNIAQPECSPKYINEENSQTVEAAAKAVAGMRSLASAILAAKGEKRVADEATAVASSEASQAEGSDGEASSSAYDSDATDLFHLEVEPARTWETPQDKDVRVAHLLASQMRRHPLVPAQPSDETGSTSFIAVQSGIKLPGAHCAFKGCCWTGSTKNSIEAHIVCKHSAQLLAAEKEVYGLGSYYGSSHYLSKAHYRLNMCAVVINSFIKI